MENIESIEKRLWEAADDLRANSKLTSTEYYMPVLGLIFLRHAYNRFLKVEEEVKETLPSRGGVTRPITREDFISKSALYLKEKARFEYLINLPEDRDRGQAIIEAMDAIEEDYEDLRGVLPKEYHIFDSDLLTRLLKVFNDEALKEANGDVFGRIYEYFIMKFAIQGAQDNGEFFTPVSLVQLIVNTIEPHNGVVLDPACGSGGMFVQTSHFLDNQGLKANSAVTFYGQEKTTATIRLAKMNLAVHGLEGRIAEANTFYEDHHELIGKSDYVMANPPFNVDKVDAEKVKTDPRLPFGLPGINQKNEVSNGNYLWMSYFYSYLNKEGRAGFVMSSQASSAGSGEKEVRRKIVETGHVDVMIAIRSNFFYTRTVPCELWFYDKGKPSDKLDKVLMIDARNVYRKVSRKINDFSPEQLKNLTSIIWLYRGQQDRYLNLIKEYLDQISYNLKMIPNMFNEFNESSKGVKALLNLIVERFKDQRKSNEETFQIFLSTIAEIENTINLKSELESAVLDELTKWNAEKQNLCLDKNNQQIQLSKSFEPISITIKTLGKQIDENYKLLIRAVEFAEKNFDIKNIDSTWKSRKVNTQIKETNEIRKMLIEKLKRLNYMYRQVNWLQTRFPEAELRDVQGLVKLVDRSEIEENDWSLTPGRYVGVAPEEKDEDFDFEESIKDIHIELNGLNEEAIELAKIINLNLKELGI